MKNTIYLLISMACLLEGCSQSTSKDQPSAPIPEMETGAQPMPDEWIDQDTGHKLMKLVRRGGSNRSFYFHKNPFVPAKEGEQGDLMVFYGSTDQGNQLFIVNLETQKTEQLTDHPTPIHGEMVAPQRREVFYQSNDSIFATQVDTRQTRLVYVYPEDFKATITSLNADETLLAGVNPPAVG